MFDSAYRGERVCLRSEGLGPGKCENLSSLFSWKFRLAAALSLSVAWTAALLRSPAFAEEKRACTTDNTPIAGAVSQNTFRLDGNPVVPVSPVQNIIGSVERYGNLYAPPPTDSETIWRYIHALKTFNGFPRNASNSAELVRVSIINRAENDRIVSTDEIIELSNLYRKEGFESGADNCLGIANTLLDYGKNHDYAVVARGLTHTRIGGEVAFHYDQETRNQLYDWETTFDQIKKSEDVVNALSAMRSIVQKILENPIMLVKLTASDMQQLRTNIERLKKFCGDSQTLSNVEQLESLVQERRYDFASVRLTPDDED